MSYKKLSFEKDGKSLSQNKEIQYLFPYILKVVSMLHWSGWKMAL
jgi:hypothetical protein